jgi:hypothetical protein
MIKIIKYKKNNKCKTCMSDRRKSIARMSGKIGAIKSVITKLCKFKNKRYKEAIKIIEEICNSYKVL